MANEVNKFMATKIKAEILESLYSDLEYKLKDASMYYGKTGNQKQKMIWNKETKDYDPQFDESGEPIMEDEWGDIEYTEEELEDHPEVVARISVIKQLMKDMEKML